jgi:hypothetical protein
MKNFKNNAPNRAAAGSEQVQRAVAASFKATLPATLQPASVVTLLPNVPVPTMTEAEPRVVEP